MYTKGEWEVIEMNNGTSRIIVEGEEDEQICEYITSEPNAHLIAAAPDMYEALKIWLDKLAPYSLKQKIQMMEQALSKAEVK